MSSFKLTDEARLAAQTACVSWQKRESKTPLRTAAQPVAEWVKRHGGGSSRESIAQALLSLAVNGYITAGEVTTLSRYVSPGATADITGEKGLSIRAALSEKGDKVGFILGGTPKGESPSDTMQRWYVARDVALDPKRFANFLTAVREAAYGLAEDIC